MRFSNMTTATASSCVAYMRAPLLRFACAVAFFLWQRGLPSMHLCITPRACSEQIHVQGPSTALADRFLRGDEA